MCCCGRGVFLSFSLFHMALLLSYAHLDFLENAHRTLCLPCAAHIMCHMQSQPGYGCATQWCLWAKTGQQKLRFIGNIASCVAIRGYFWRNIETCALKMFECERLFVNSTALNLSHVAILMMTRPDTIPGDSDFSRLLVSVSSAA